MAGHRPSDLYPQPRSSGGEPGVPVLAPVESPVWLSNPAVPGKMMIRPGFMPGVRWAPEMWGLPLGPPVYEFQGQMGSCVPRVGAGEVGARLQSLPVGTFPRHCIFVKCSPQLALPEDITGLEKEMEELARELRQKRMTLGCSQADVGFAVGALFGKVLSQTTICRFEAQQLSLANMWKLRPLLKMWLQEVDDENLPGLCRMEMILRQARKQRRESRQRRIGNNLERLFLRCPTPTPEQISGIAGQLRLQEDLVQGWFSNRSKMGPWPAKDDSLPEEVEATKLPFPGEPVRFPLAPGLHLASCPYRGSFFTPLYPSVPFPIGANLSAPAPTLGLPRLSR